jgi:PAS domain S-box-containing protein
MTERPAADDHRVIFDASPALIWYKDRQNRILRCNLTAATSIGRTVEECEGASTFDLYPQDAAKYYADDMDVINSGKPKLGIIEPYRVGTDERWMRTDKIPYRNPDGEIIGVIVFALDITDQKRAEIKAQQALEEADRANRAKSTFLANVSHEIRTPLGVILGFADLLRASDVDDEQRRSYADKIMRNGRRLLGLVNEILDLAKIERGRIAIESSSFSLQELVNEAASSLEARAAAKHLQLIITIHENVPQYVVTDPARVRQILVNLLDNAIKFTDQGIVCLTVDARRLTPPSADGSMTLVFTVEDTGKGIDEATAQELFKPFSQGDPSLARRHGGVGLGLALSRQLAKHLGGNVELTASVPGHGSRFTLTVKAREGAPAAPRPKSQPPGLKPARVLIAEDHPDLRELLVSYVEGTPLQVTTCADGDNAVRLALTERPDVILMDLALPAMDGKATMLALREQGYRAPIIAVTAHAMKGAREEALAAGFDEFLPKPVERDELLRAIAASLR